MLKRPDLQPNATMNRWVQGILLFDFELIHVPAVEFKGPDALSRREASQEEINEAEEDDDWLDEIALYSTYPMLPLFSQGEHTHSTCPTSLVDDTRSDQTLHDVKAF